MSVMPHHMLTENLCWK